MRLLVKERLKISRKVNEMESTKEQMGIIHSMVWKEINLLKMNLDTLIRDSERCQKMLKELISPNRATNLFGLIVFNRYMSQMTAALNMARKYNIHLEINNLEQTVISGSTNGYLDDSNLTQTRFLNDFIEWRKTCFENGIGYEDKSNAFAGSIKMFERITEANKALAFGLDNSGIKSLELNGTETKNECTSYKTNDVTKKIDNLLKILLPAKSLRQFKRGFEFEACVVYIRDYKKLEFFICLNDDYKTLHNISSNMNFKPISHELLPIDDVFCVLEKTDSAARECFCRAVIMPDQRHESQKFIYLIDFGEVIPLTDNCKTYIAPIRYRQIPPLAIKCILEGIEDPFSKCVKDQEKCKQVLQKHEFEKANFRIIHQIGCVLHVVMLENLKTTKSSTPVGNNKQTNPFLNSKNVGNDDQNSIENSDDLQLPKFDVYNPPAAIEPVLNIPFKVGDKIQVIVTHVVSPISFYGIIQSDYCSDYKTFSWHDRQIFPSQKQLSAPPRLNNIVLSQYTKDGYWYRAKVINIDSDTDLYRVFYVDFGNTEVVPLSSLAQCSKEQLIAPLRAVLFHISNLSIASDKPNVYSCEKTHFDKAIENIVVMLLDQIINVEIIERRSDDLVVRLIDSQYADVPRMLLDMGVVKEI